MTVIAYRDGVLAADSGAWWGDIFIGTGRKIERLPDGSLLATAGRWSDAEIAKQWFGSQEGERPKVDDDFSGLLVSTKGEVFQLSTSMVPFLLTAPFFADGCGHQIALGAMHMGATAEQAVAVACLYHAKCSLPVQVQHISMALREVA